MVGRYKNYFSPRKNVLRLRRQFYRRTQQTHEDTEAYLRALFTASEYCDFADRKESIRDQFVSGILNEDLAEKIELLYYSKDGQLSLDDVVEYSRTYNDVHDGRKLEKEQTKSVDAVHMYKQNVKNRSGGTRPKEEVRQSGKSCRYCGRSHLPMKCPAYGKECLKCKKLNHFANMCRQGVNKVDAVSNSNYEGVSYTNDDTELDYQESQTFLGEVCDGISHSATPPSDVYVKHSDKQNEVQVFLGEIACRNDLKPGTEAMRVIMEIGLMKVSFKVDTGADVSIMNYDTFLRVKANDKFRLEKSDKKLGSPAGNVEVVGMCRVPLNYKNKELHEVVYVLPEKSHSENLLSRGAAVKLQIISFLGAIKNESIFGFGKWDTEPVKLSLTEGAETFRIRSARTVAIPLLSAVKENLQNLEENDVIEKVTHPTDWVSPMVPVAKPRHNAAKLEVRLCVDYRQLNRHLRRELFEIPTFDDVISRFHGAKFFTKLDAKSGFYQIPLDESARDLTTFITPTGRYRFKRLPMGISIAPEIFQRKMTELLEGLPGVVCYLDDIVITGATREEHDQNLDKVLNAIRLAGLKLNKEKCVFGQSEIEFLGHTVRNEGVKISTEKVDAVLKFGKPNNVQELRRFLGMVNFLARFVPRLQSTIQPLNLLLSKKNA